MIVFVFFWRKICILHFLWFKLKIKLKELSLCRELKSCNPYIFANLKILGCKDIGFRNSDFVTKTQFLSVVIGIASIFSTVIFCAFISRFFNAYFRWITLKFAKKSRNFFFVTMNTFNHQCFLTEGLTGWSWQQLLHLYFNPL